jgi:hypothetical protein
VNRRSFFASPLALLPGAAPPAFIPGAIIVNLSGAFKLDKNFVDNELAPALRAAIADRDVIPPGSRQGREL